jgi:hypothetical protein
MLLVANEVGSAIPMERKFCDAGPRSCGHIKLPYQSQDHLVFRNFRNAPNQRRDDRIIAARYAKRDQDGAIADYKTIALKTDPCLGRESWRFRNDIHNDKGDRGVDHLDSGINKVH